MTDNKPRLTDQDITDAAALLSLSRAKILAVRDVESGPLGGFDQKTGKPIILFEPHIFHRLTKGIYSRGHGGVSYPTWGSKPYPKTQAERWAQLEYAENLDATAAWQSASFGLFQIMGFNYEACGFDDIDDFAIAMHESEREHLMAFCKFIKFNGIDDELRDGDYEAFVRRYNGPGQVKRYSAKLRERVAFWSSKD